MLLNQVFCTELMCLKVDKPCELPLRTYCKESLLSSNSQHHNDLLSI